MFLTNGVVWWAPFFCRPLYHLLNTITLIVTAFQYTNRTWYRWWRWTQHWAFVWQYLCFRTLKATSIGHWLVYFDSVLHNGTLCALHRFDFSKCPIRGFLDGLFNVWYMSSDRTTYGTQFRLTILKMTKRVSGILTETAENTVTCITSIGTNVPVQILGRTTATQNRTSSMSQCDTIAIIEWTLPGMV